MKIAYTSDLHVDVNKDFDLTKKIINYLKSYMCKTIIIAGDISSNYDTTIGVINKFKNAGIKAYFVSGNHDIYTGVKYTDSYKIYKKYCEHPYCLANQSLEIGSSIVIGDVGWYDYTFRDPFNYAMQQIEKKDGWMDKYRISFDDLPFCDYQNSILESRLSIAKEFHPDKEIILVTHMVPTVDLCRQYPNTYFDAFTGSQLLWNIAVKYGVKTWIYGHSHINWDFKIEGIRTTTSPIGYCGEWNGLTVEEQIEKQVKFIDV